MSLDFKVSLILNKYPILIVNLSILSRVLVKNKGFNSLEKFHHIIIYEVILCYEFIFYIILSKLLKYMLVDLFLFQSSRDYCSFTQFLFLIQHFLTPIFLPSFYTQIL